MAKAILLGSGFENVVCYQGYATAQATPQDMDRARVLFTYDLATATWTAIGAGTAMACADKVPADVIEHLDGCADY